MFLVFTPCLYCDVSDSWSLRTKWQRIAVSLAGIWVEMVLAALFTFLWHFSQPGPFNLFCLNVMIVCGISTISLNGNPLLRYDGYYILSDMVEIPNLWSRSRQELRRILGRICLGLDRPEEIEMRTECRWALAAYATASIIYRWVVVAAIIWLIHSILEPVGLESLAIALAVLIVGGAVWNLIRQAYDLARSTGVRRQMDKCRCLLTCAVVVVVVSLVCLIPVKHRVQADAVVQPGDAARVYVKVPGRLSAGALPGTRVAAGDELGVLVNHDLDRDVARLSAELRGQEAKLRFLETVQGDHQESAGEIPPTLKIISDLKDRIVQLTADQERLVISSPRDGVVLASPGTPPKSESAMELPIWSGHPLQPENRGAALDAGTLFCLVGKPASLELILTVRQEDIQLVARGQTVAIRMDAYPGKTIRGEIAQIASLDEDRRIEHLSPHNSPLGSSPRRNPLPTEVAYQVKVTLPEDVDPMVFGSCGQARVDTGSRPLASRLYRMIWQTF